MKHLDWTESEINGVCGWKAKAGEVSLYFISATSGGVGVFHKSTGQWHKAGAVTSEVVLQDFHHWHTANELDLGIRPDVPIVEHFYV